MGRNARLYFIRCEAGPSPPASTSGFALPPSLYTFPRPLGRGRSSKPRGFRVLLTVMVRVSTTNCVIQIINGGVTTMNIPGFTAEYAIDVRSSSAGKFARRRSVRLNPAVSPAMVDIGGECISRCEGDPESAFLCQTSGDIGGGGSGGGGGGGTHCNVGCGPCQQIDGRYQRACVQANCNVHYVACGPSTRGRP